jgi:hypothetical protein
LTSGAADHHHLDRSLAAGVDQGRLCPQAWLPQKPKEVGALFFPAEFRQKNFPPNFVESFPAEFCQIFSRRIMSSEFNSEPKNGPFASPLLAHN